MSSGLSRFSQRKGLTPVRSAIQRESIDEVLRTRLWNNLYENYWHKGFESSYEGYCSDDNAIWPLVLQIWKDFYNAATDTISQHVQKNIDYFKRYLFDCAWYKVYDFIEFCANNCPSEEINSKFIDECNVSLKKELSAYRFVDKLITEITSSEEINEIEEALRNPIKVVHKGVYPSDLDSSLR